MAKKITDLRTTTKTETTSRQYLLVSDIGSKESTKIALNDVFPALQSGKETGTVTTGTAGAIQDLFVGGGVGSTATNTNKSTLIFKGLKTEVNTSGSQTAALELRTDTSTADPNKKNLVAALNVHKIGLNNADNTSSKFLSEVGGVNALSLAQPGVHFTGTLGVANGGTGLTSGTAGGILSFSASDTMNVITFRNKGSLLVGQTSAAPIELTAPVTNNYVLMSDNTVSAGLKWGKATFEGGTITTNLVLSSADIVTGTNYISGSGTASQGLRFNSSSDNVYIGAGTFYSTGRLNVDGNLYLGSSNGSTAADLKMVTTTVGASPNFTIQGANAQGTGLNAGRVIIKAGTGEDNNSNGGSLYLEGGLKDGTGTDGSVFIRTGASGVASTAVTVDANQDLTVNSGSLIITSATEGIVHAGSGTVTQATSFSTGVTLNATSGVITLHNGSTLAGDTTAVFTVTNSTVQADSVILVTLLDGTGTANSRLATGITSVSSGSFNVFIHNSKNATSTAGTVKVHFLVINNSV